jgi:hypothetical protein
MNILRQRSLQLSASSWTLLRAIVEEVVPNEIAKSLLLARNGHRLDRRKYTLLIQPRHSVSGPLGGNTKGYLLPTLRHR